MTAVDVRVCEKLVLTTPEAAALTGRSRNYITALCELGVIRAHRRSGGQWRITRTDLDAWIASGMPEAEAAR